ncbi:hypothetical protein DV515_00018194 [Chloebia gouldiae]|uniref:Uncharacterized protein n=1 Tax=Chloebia gouldiae TaxID=44316 RepID=A0A3L8Q885_CHLGU|nr:hypothetical protein DV515_00018194 [Chloebia gouldiae]
MGTTVADHARDLLVRGLGQTFTVDGAGEVSVPYVVLDTDGKGHHLWPVFGLEPGTRGLSYRGRGPHWPHSSSPATDAGCWFDAGVICNGGMDAGFVDSSHASLAGQSGGDARSVRSAAPGPDTTNVAVAEENAKGSSNLPLLLLLFNQQGLVASVQGDWVWLKKFPGEQHTEVKPATKLTFCKLRDLRHENVNLFLGFFHDCGIFAVVSEHCSRGSLEDLLRNEDMKLDWMFKSSLLIDLIKVAAGWPWWSGGHGVVMGSWSTTL